MRATLEYIEDVAHNIRTFWFRPDKPAYHTAGQFTQVHLPLLKPDARGTKHWFTISSSPTEELIGLTTKFTPSEGSAFKQALRDLKPGAELTLADPMGDFVLPRDPSIPLLFVAGGIGVTPYRSMIRWLSDMNEKRDIHLLYSVRHPQEIAFPDLFQGYDMKFTSVVTEPDASWQGETGFLTPERIRQFIHPDPRTLVYLAGPEPMVEAFVDELKRQGLPGHRLVTDYFPGYETV
jgi:glycine betaine catabolism B